MRSSTEKTIWIRYPIRVYTDINLNNLRYFQVLVPIQKDVASLMVRLEEERNIRKSKEAIYAKNLQNAVVSVEKAMDVEKFNREQQLMDVKVLISVALFR